MRQAPAVTVLPPPDGREERGSERDCQKLRAPRRRHTHTTVTTNMGKIAPERRGGGAGLAGERYRWPGEYPGRLHCRSNCPMHGRDGVMGLVTIRPVTVISSFPLSRSVSRSLSSSLSRLSLFLLPSVALNSTKYPNVPSGASAPYSSRLLLHIVGKLGTGAQYEATRTRPPEPDPRTEPRTEPRNRNPEPRTLPRGFLVSSFCAGGAAGGFERGCRNLSSLSLLVHSLLSFSSPFPPSLIRPFARSNPRSHLLSLPSLSPTERRKKGKKRKRILVRFSLPQQPGKLTCVAKKPSSPRAWIRVSFFFFLFERSNSILAL